jgi:hypothetical protein
MKKFSELRQSFVTEGQQFKPLFAVRGRNSYAAFIDGVDSNGYTSSGVQYDVAKQVDAFKKTAKKTYADTKGKKSLPAVKKHIKMVGAKQYFAQWQSDSSSHKDDSIEIYYTK